MNLSLLLIDLLQMEWYQVGRVVALCEKRHTRPQPHSDYFAEVELLKRPEETIGGNVDLLHYLLLSHCLSIHLCEHVIC